MFRLFHQPEKDQEAIGLLNDVESLDSQPLARSVQTFERLSVDMFLKIASYLHDWHDLASLFLVNKMAYQRCQDDSNHRLESIMVDLPLRSGVATVPFKNVNHVVMANYFLKIKLDDLEAEQHDQYRLLNRNNRVCEVAVWGCGIGSGLAVGVGTFALCYYTLVPTIFTASASCFDQAVKYACCYGACPALSAVTTCSVPVTFADAFECNAPCQDARQRDIERISDRISYLKRENGPILLPSNQHYVTAASLQCAMRG